MYVDDVILDEKVQSTNNHRLVSLVDSLTNEFEKITTLENLLIGDLRSLTRDQVNIESSYRAKIDQLDQMGSDERINELAELDKINIHIASNMEYMKLSSTITEMDYLAYTNNQLKLFNDALTHQRYVLVIYSNILRTITDEIKKVGATKMDIKRKLFNSFVSFTQSHKDDINKLLQERWFVAFIGVWGSQYNISVNVFPNEYGYMSKNDRIYFKEKESIDLLNSCNTLLDDVANEHKQSIEVDVNETIFSLSDNFNYTDYSRIIVTKLDEFGAMALQDSKVSNSLMVDIDNFLDAIRNYDEKNRGGMELSTTLIQLTDLLEKWLNIHLLSARLLVAGVSDLYTFATTVQTTINASKVITLNKSLLSAFSDSTILTS